MLRDTKGLASPGMSEGQHRPDRRHAEAPVVGLTGARFGGATGRRLRRTGQPAPGVADTANSSTPDADRPAVGLTGARFGPSSGHRHSRPNPDQPAETDRRIGQQSSLRPVPAPPSPEPGTAVPEQSTHEGEWVVDETDWDGSEESYGLVRPYAWTRGRTTARHELALEALISASVWNLDATASPEHHAILRLCSTPRSVAEVAALLSVPLGVARVLLGDMAESGNVVVHRTAGTADGAPDLALMQRVLTCLQRL